MNRTSLHKELREWFEWTKDNVKSMVIQIIEDKELTTPLTKISQRNKQKFQEDIDKIANKVIDKEIEYYIEHYKVRSKEDYANILERLSKEEILEIKTRCCNEVLDEKVSKNGR